MNKKIFRVIDEIGFISILVFGYCMIGFGIKENYLTKATFENITVEQLSLMGNIALVILTAVALLEFYMMFKEWQDKKRAVIQARINYAIGTGNIDEIGDPRD